MTTVTGLTAARMQEIIDTTVVDGHIDGDDLILTTNDSTEINAGNVRGPMGSTGPTGGYITGEVRMGVIGLGGLPPDWFFLDGGTLTNAETLYPSFWAIAPTSWKSGSSIHFPNTFGKFVTSVDPGDELGAITGNDNITLAPANLPSHNHGAGSLAAAAGGVHNHDPSDPSYEFVIHKPSTASSLSINAAASSSVGVTYTPTTDNSPSHTHDVTGITSNQGSGTPYAHRPANLGLSLMIYLGPHA